MGEKRTLTDRLSGEMAREYANHQQVLASILRPFATLKAKPSEIRGARIKVDEIVRRLNIIAVRWAKAAISEAYASKRAEVAPIAKKASVFTDGRSDAGSSTVARLVEKAAAGFVDANNTIGRTVGRFLSAYEKAIGAVDGAKPAQFMAANMEAEISRKVDYYLARGYDEGSISRKLRQYLEKLVDGKDFIEINGRFYGLKAFAEKMARSNLHDAYVEATLEECKKWDCDLVQFSRHDSPCPICKMLEGRVFSISGEDETFPPLSEPVEVEVMTKTEIKTIQVDVRAPHLNCCLPGTTCEPVGDIVAGSRSIYDGVVFEFVFSDSSYLSVTENHLLLTPHGFAPAYLLCKGDDVFGCAGPEGMSTFNPNDYREPALIDQIVAALAKTPGMTSRSVPISPENFHGDGQFLQGDIHVVGADGLLGDTGKSGLLQKSEKENFQGAGTGAKEFSCDRPFASVLKSLVLAADGVMGGCRTAASIFLARAGSGDPMTFADSPEIAADFKEPHVDGLVGHSELLCKIALQSARQIQTKKIVAVNAFPYHGFVYDLQTETSLYIAGGILSSNCEHNLDPVTRAILEANGEL